MLFGVKEMFSRFMRQSRYSVIQVFKGRVARNGIMGRFMRRAVFLASKRSVLQRLSKFACVAMVGWRTPKQLLLPPDTGWLQRSLNL